MWDADRQRLATDIGLLWLRVTIGAMMLGSHGWGKLMKLMGPGPVQFADPFGLGAGPSLFLAVGAEVACAALLIVGLATRAAALPLLITMLVAAFIIHGDDPFKKQEFALLYAVPCVTLMLTGPGRLSLDTLVLGWWRARQEGADEKS